MDKAQNGRLIDLACSPHYHQGMFKHVVPFDETWAILRGHEKSKPLRSFITFLERRLGFEALYDTERFPSGDPALTDMMELAERLKTAGIIRSIEITPHVDDEPRLFQWRIRFRDGDESYSGGSSSDDMRAALTASLAEAVERHIWFEREDHFKKPTVAPDRLASVMLPERFAGFTAAQRITDDRFALAGKEYLWIEGRSLIDGKKIFVPAQTVSAAESVRTRVRNGLEPIIIRQTTTGLATWPTQEGAIVRGALEVIERDAYMITWLNQLSPHKMDLTILCDEHPPLKALVEKCARYRLKVHIMRMPTDAPAYALMCVVEDETDHVPRYAVGLKAKRNPAESALGALVEALRARRGARAQYKKAPTDQEAHAVGHYDRLGYWAQPGRATRLEFLIEGETEARDLEAWEHENDEEYLSRLSAWCSERDYGFAHVSFTKSGANLTPWHIEFALIPEMQPIHYFEKQPHTGGARLSQIPALFGFAARATPYLDDPHPFA